jgi:hypothetical protein
MINFARQPIDYWQLSAILPTRWSLAGSWVFPLRAQLGQRDHCRLQFTLLKIWGSAVRREPGRRTRLQMSQCRRASSAAAFSNDEISRPIAFGEPHSRRHGPKTKTWAEDMGPRIQALLNSGAALVAVTLMNLPS